VLSARAGKHILLRLEGVDSREAAQRLRGTDLWIPSSEAMALPPGEFFVDDIIGLTMVTDTGQTLGTVRDILTTGANDVYIVAGSPGDILIPAIHDVVREIDVTRGTIVIHPMDGLLE
jgi:16S rRNA processing protein RimM